MKLKETNRDHEMGMKHLLLIQRHEQFMCPCYPFGKHKYRAKKGGHSNLVAFLILSKKSNGYSLAENPDVPGIVWWMVKPHDNSSFYLSLCHRLNYYPANY